MDDDDDMCTRKNEPELQKNYICDRPGDETRRGKDRRSSLALSNTVPEVVVLDDETLFRFILMMMIFSWHSEFTFFDESMCNCFRILLVNELIDIFIIMSLVKQRMRAWRMWFETMAASTTAVVGDSSTRLERIESPTTTSILY